MSNYFINQVIVILFLFVTGAMFCDIVTSICKCKDNGIWWRTVLAYPAGLAIWGLIGFFLLLCQIPYGKVSIFTAYLLLYTTLLVFSFGNRNYPKLTVRTVIVLVGVLLLAMICCSGILRVSVSNDSFYYYSIYPQTIAKEGRYLRSFDVFLTDVGQTTAIIGTLPWFFDFEEIFGIQLFLGFNLTALFALTVYELMLPKCRKIYAFIFAAAAAIVLTSITPYVVMTRWVLANIFFMAFLFVLFALTLRITNSDSQFRKRDCVLVFLFSAMLSMTRMEGGMMTCLLILAAISVRSIENRILLLYYLLPVALTQILYYIDVYLVIKVDPLYSFLNYTNVFIQIGFIAAILIYILVFRKEKFIFINKYYSVLLIMGLILGNGFLAVISSERYIGNLRFFLLNILQQNGWGYFAFFVLFMLLILPMGKIDIRKLEISFSMLFTIGFVLFTIAVCWARNGTLRVGIGDSGNRVLMQVIPFAVYTLAEKAAEYITGRRCPPPLSEA